MISTLRGLYVLALPQRLVGREVLLKLLETKPTIEELKPSVLQKALQLFVSSCLPVLVPKLGFPTSSFVEF
jgi:hypothetical protein